MVDGGATRPLPRDEGVEELHGDPTVGHHPKVWTRGQKWKWCPRWRAGEARMRDSQGGAAPTPRRLNVVVRSPPLYPRGGPKWRDNYPEGPDHPVAPNRLESYQ